ncbi:3-deoxy-7-phosphoheptulonate synthase [Kallotenue papyrolyticum]|uniref:3-deoxy-7-phosphoheptulonate synthase n=1 Tax=Kallotenue papyrolyticum TaxID=1325125 RepID=UPI00049251F1|nr:3-deoxy-7-phosphoheptulonate synthase [Kallotenue papyrolyticum]
MIVVMRPGATTMQINEVLDRLGTFNLKGELSQGEERVVIGVLGAPIPAGLGQALEALPGVEKTLRITAPYKLASREFHPLDTVVRVRDVEIGGNELVVMAGPCSVESRDQLLRTAEGVRERGAKLLRGGAYKPRTSPYAFRGLGEQGLELLAEARERTGLAIVTEVMTPADVPVVGQYTDVFQIGARNMQNYLLLEEVGRTDKPVLLKRGLAATIEEWLLAAEYIMAQGNRQVILCERGIRTFETATRNTFDLNAVALVKRLSHLPVIADPSHGTGKWYLVPPLSLAAIAAGADGLIVEVHPDPDRALSDGAQSLTLENFGRLMQQAQAVAQALGRSLTPEPLSTI